MRIQHVTHSSRPLRPNLVSVGVSRLAHGTRGVSPLNKIAYVPEERRHLKLVLPRFRFEPRWPRVDPWPEPLWPEPAVRVRWGSDVVQVEGQQFFEKAWPALTRFDPDPNPEPLQPECRHGRRTIGLIFCTCSGSSSRNPCLGSFWLVYFDYTSPIH